MGTIFIQIWRDLNPLESLNLAYHHQSDLHYQEVPQEILNYQWRKDRQHGVQGHGLGSNNKRRK